MAIRFSKFKLLLIQSILATTLLVTAQASHAAKLRACQTKFVVGSEEYWNVLAKAQGIQARNMVHSAVEKLADRVWGSSPENSWLVDEWKRQDPQTITLEEQINRVATLTGVTYRSLEMQFGFHNNTAELMHPRWLTVRLLVAEIERLAAVKGDSNDFEEDLEEYRKNFRTVSQVTSKRIRDLDILAGELAEAGLLYISVYNRLSGIDSKMRMIRNSVWSLNWAPVASEVWYNARYFVPRDSRRRFNIIANEANTAIHFIFYRGRIPSRSIHDGFLKAVRERAAQFLQ